MDDEFNSLDDDWINKFENTDKLYQEFYKDDLYYVNLRAIYVNRENEIDKIRNESFLMSKPNQITQEEIIQILKKNSIDNDKRYTLLSILKYNINLEPDNVKEYLLEKINPDYLFCIKNIDVVNFDKTINMFQDLNDLIVIYYEKSFVKSNANNSTKKVYIRSLNTNKKTIRNRYKD